MAKKNKQQRLSADDTNKQKKITKNQSQKGVNVGRPKKQDKIQFISKQKSPIQTISWEIQKKLMRFFDKIGKKNGPTLSIPIRLKVNKQRVDSGKKPLGQQDKRSRLKQLQKIQEALKKFKSLNIQSVQVQQVITVLKEILQKSCGIFSQDFTQQIYDILTRILNILYSKRFKGQQQLDTALDLLGKQVLNPQLNQQETQYEFFNFKMGVNSKQSEIKLNPSPKEDPQKNERAYCQLMRDIGNSLDVWLKQNEQTMLYKVQSEEDKFKQGMMLDE